MTIAVPQPPQNGCRKIEDEGRLGAIELVYNLMIPFALKAVIQVGALDLLAQQGPGGCLSARQIVELLPTKCDRSVEYLDRHLRYLASSNVLTQSFEPERINEAANGGLVHGAQFGERKYGLGPVCEYLVQKPGSLSLVPLLELNLLNEAMGPVQLFRKAITDGIQPFSEANGKSLYEHTVQDPQFGAIFNTAMASKSAIFFEGIVEHYDGFQELQEKTLVDVAGGIGCAMSIVVAKWPKIRAINFDLPACVASAPQIPGVEHQGGDMFVSVPSADAIFMKWILHNWTDEDCLKILNNCYKALPANGKLIVVDAVVPASYMDNSSSTKVTLGLDLLMLTWTKGGRERTEEEFKSLFYAAGFQKSELVLQVDFLSVIECRK